MVRIRFSYWVLGVCGLIPGVLGACSSDEGEPDSTVAGAGSGTVTAGTGGSSGSGGLSGAAGSSAGSSNVPGGGRGGSGSAASGGAAGGAAQGKDFWCDGYPHGADVSPGWIEIQAVVSAIGTGSMTSPIVGCQKGAGSFVVSAMGEEQDEIDTTSMRFEITSGYDGPGVYEGRIQTGLNAAFSHSDVGAFASTAVTDCKICVNGDELSGTVSCIGLEAPAGELPAVGHVPSGAFTCPGAAAKPESVAVTPAQPLESVLCHYIDKLGCPGATSVAACESHIADIGLEPLPCYVEYDRWGACFVGSRPTEFTCGTSDTLELTSGDCATELTTLETCRANGGGGSGPGDGGPNDLTATPECDAFCAQQMAACGTECDRGFDCVVPGGWCKEAQLEYLRCGADPSAWQCGDGGFSLVCRGYTLTCP